MNLTINYRAIQQTNNKLNFKYSPDQIQDTIRILAIVGEPQEGEEAKIIWDTYFEELDKLQKEKVTR